LTAFGTLLLTTGIGCFVDLDIIEQKGVSRSGNRFIYRPGNPTVNTELAQTAQQGVLSRINECFLVPQG